MNAEMQVEKMHVYGDADRQKGMDLDTHVEKIM